MTSPLQSARGPRGLTLVEVLVVVAFFGMLLSALFVLFIGFNRFVRAQQANVEVVRGASLIVSEFQSFAMQAYRVVDSITVDGITHLTGSSTLILALPAIDEGTVPIHGAYDHVIMYASSTRAVRILEPHELSARLGGQRTLSNSLESLQFFYDNASPSEVSRIEVEVLAREELPDRTVESQLRQQVYLRNK